MTVTTVTRNVVQGIWTYSRFFSLYDTTGEAASFPTSMPAGGGFRLGTEVDEDNSVVVSDQFDEDLLSKLLQVNEVITVANHYSFMRYLDTLYTTVHKNRHAIRSTRNLGKELSMAEYISLLGSITPIGGGDAPRRYRGTQDSSTVYFMGVPDVMLGLWNKYTDHSPLSLYAKVEGGVQKLDLSGEVANLCMRLEPLQSAGCLACPSRGGCTAALLQEEVGPVNIPLDTLKKKVHKLGIRTLPHSDCKSQRYASGKVSLNDLDMSEAEGNNVRARELREATTLNKKFYRENCASCALKELCGSSRGYTMARKGVRTFCTGKTPEGSKLEITPYNYRKALGVMLSSMLLLARKDQSIVPACVNLITTWVESEAVVPSHAAQLINMPYGKDTLVPYAVPAELIGVAELFSLQGDYMGHDNYHCGHGIGRWFKDVTTSVTGLVGDTRAPSGWYAILPGSSRLVPEEWYNYTQYQYIDTRALSQISGETRRSRTSVYQSKQARLDLVLEFLKLFVSPSRRVHHGPFGSSVAFVSRGMPSMRDYRQLATPGKKADYYRLSATDNLVTIFKDLRGVVYYDIEVLQNTNRLKDVITNG